MKQLTILFLIRGEEVLLAMKKRGFGAGRWNGVGGKVESGETVEQALVRECQEEIGVTPIRYQSAGTIVFHEFHGDAALDMEVHVFVAHEWEGQPTETEEMAPQWFQVNDLPFDDMWADDPYWLPQMLAGSKIKAEFTLDDKDQLVAHDVAVTGRWNT